MNRSTINYALAGVLALGVGLVLLNQKQEQKKAAAAEEKGPPLLALKRDEVTRIAIAHPGQPEIRLDKKDGQWALTAPIAARADAVEIGNLLAFADTPTRGTLDLAQVKLADLGLDPPGYTLTLNDRVITIGGTEPIKYTRYVELDAGQPSAAIRLIDDIGGAATDADYSDLVAKSLLPPNAEIASIEVPGLALAKSADGKGWTATPASPDATSDALQKLADAWKEAHALSIELRKANLAAATKPDLATITLADGSVLRYTIDAREPQLMLGSEALGLDYRLGHDQIEKLLALAKPKPAPAASADGKDAAPAEPKADAPATKP